MKKILILTAVSIIYYICPVLMIDVLAVDNLIELPVLSEDIPVESENNPEQADKLKSINLDMQALYGVQYNQMFSGLSLSQEKNPLVYLLTVKFNRSADFGFNDERYVNSGFYENTAGLTVNWNWAETKLIVDGETDNESRGMFTNDVYSREDKGNNKISAKTIFKVSPSTEIFFSIGGARYKHSLIPVIESDLMQSRVLQGNIQAGGEYVWSASNRMRINGDLLYYDYVPDDVEKDRHIKGEIIDDFNITRNIGISIGVGYINNKDGGDIRFPVPVSASLSLKEFKYLTMALQYKYDIIPFQPEEFYLKQKYINPSYTLPPELVHSGEIKTESRINSTFSFKGSFKAEKNSNYYNYFPTDENVLSAETIDVITYNPSIEANLTVYKKIWDISLAYNYFYFEAENNITYEPDHEASGSIRYNGKNWKFEWVNELRGSVYTSPDSDERLPVAFMGSLGIQRQMLEGSYFYGKIENLYNNKYSLRKGYPEPGISFLGGLRVLI